MRRVGITGLFLFAAVRAGGQDDSISLPQIIQGAQQWAQENLDTNILNALQDVDQQKVEQLFRDLQQQFQGEYVVNLADLRDTAE